MSAALVLAVALKVAVLLGLALATVTLLRRRAAETRHRVLALALAGSIALPALVLVLPGWNVLPNPWRQHGEVSTTTVPPDPTSASAVRVSRPPPSGLESSSSRADGTPSTSAPSRSEARFARPSVAAVLAWAWAGGATALIVLFLLQVAALHRLVRRARPLGSPEWRARLDSARRALGLERTVELRLAGPGVMPLAWGLRRPVVLLPDEALGWSEGRATAVLGHELAHVARRDVAWSLVARVARALHWFDPLAWVLHRRLRGAAEHAADELALRQDLRPADYAEHLLEVATASTRRHALAPIMATRTDLEERIMAVLQREGRGRESRAARLVPLAATLVLLAPLASLGWSRGQEQEGVRLSGVVRGPDGPLEGAVVAVARARPRNGVATLCSSCYPDCRKQAVTDAEGLFVVEDLDPELEFQVLVCHPGYAPDYSAYVDPARGNAVVELEPSDLHERPPERVVRGWVHDKQGDPISGATVRPFGRVTQDGRMYGRIPGVDPLAATGANGEFELGVDESGDQVLLKIEAPSYAPTTAAITAGVEGEVTLLRGALVTGVVVKDGQPLAGVEMGLVQPMMGGDDYTGDLSIGTDESGRFTFVNVPPGKTWNLYGRMRSLGARGALSVRPVEVKEDLETVDVGRIEVEPSWTVSGRIALADGKPVPAGGRILLQAEGAQDYLVADLPADGSFRLVGAPPAAVNITVQLEDYVVSKRNASYDVMTQWALIGTVSGDVDDLVILMDPYEIPNRVTFTASGGREEWERYQREVVQAPLRGVPPDDVRDR